MSIATTESFLSVHMLDARDNLDSRRTSAEAGAREEIEEAFALMRKLPAKHVAVPAVDHRAGRVSSVSLEEAVMDMVGDGQCKAELLAVLKDSLCPLVQALREAMCAEYVRQNADDIGEFRA